MCARPDLDHLPTTGMPSMCVELVMHEHVPQGLPNMHLLH